MSSQLVQKLWNYCNVLRDDGMSYGDYVEQLIYLLFLKTADECSRPPHNQASPIAAPYAWPALLAKDGDALFDHYRHTLEELGRQPGTLALIFGKAQNKFQNEAIVVTPWRQSSCSHARALLPLKAASFSSSAKHDHVAIDPKG